MYLVANQWSLRNGCNGSNPFSSVHDKKVITETLSGEICVKSGTNS